MRKKAYNISITLSLYLSLCTYLLLSHPLAFLPVFAYSRLYVGGGGKKYLTGFKP